MILSRIRFTNKLYQIDLFTIVNLQTTHLTYMSDLIDIFTDMMLLIILSKL